MVSVTIVDVPNRAATKWCEKEVRSSVTVCVCNYIYAV